MWGKIEDKWKRKCVVSNSSLLGEIPKDE